MKNTFSIVSIWMLLIGLTIMATPPVAIADHPGGSILWPMIGFGGMIVNAANLTNIFTNIKTTFNKAFAATPTMWPKIGMKVSSVGAQNDYAWLENFPKMQRWVGDKIIKSLKAGKYVLANEDFEATIGVKRNDIEDDNLGIIAPQAEGAGYSAAQWPDELIMEKVNGAFTMTCFDGQYFVDTDHVVAGASVSNKGTAALSISTQALAIASLGAGLTAMQNMKDDEGRSLNITPNVLLVPPALRDIANALMTVNALEDGKPNLYKGQLEVVVEPRLTSSTAWFLLDTTKPVKPFIFQERKAPGFVSQTDMSSEDVFKRAVFNFGVEARGAAGFGFWQTCYGSTGAG